VADFLRLRTDAAGAPPTCGVNASPHISSLIGSVPHRIALAGGWIDQPFVSKFDPAPPGSMVVVSLEPDLWLMDRCGMAGGTRNVALKIWNGKLPNRPPADLVRELYWAENTEKIDPSGSQDMIGLIYPGVSRLDYDIAAEGGIFPAHIESNCDPAIARWLERIVHLVPINQRADGYSPLGIKNLQPDWVHRLGQTGQDCYAAILEQDIKGLAACLNQTMACWDVLLPQSLGHPVIKIDLRAVLRYFQSRYVGAAFTGCGGGYVIAISEEPVPGSLHVKVRLR
jgi:hypothetical protein